MKLSNKLKIISGLLPVLFGCIHLWNSATSLSIKKRTAVFEWNLNYGLYESEKDKRGLSFHWTKRSAGISVDNLGPTLVIPILASHPDIAKNPVKVKVFLSDSYFRKNELIEELVLKENKWIEFEYATGRSVEDKICLVIETDRAWQPLKYLKVPDPRWLAIGLGEPWFRYPKKISPERIKCSQKLSPENWEGEQENILLSRGIASIKFSAGEQQIALLLNVRVRTALGLGPYIVLRIDEKTIGKCMLNEDGWNSVAFVAEIEKGGHLFSVEFINDFYDPKKGLDRNLYLDSLEIVYLK